MLPQQSTLGVHLFFLKEDSSHSKSTKKSETRTYQIRHGLMHAEISVLYPHPSPLLFEFITTYHVAREQGYSWTHQETPIQSW